MNRKLFKEIAINYVAWLLSLTVVMLAIVYVEIIANPESNHSVNYRAFLFISFVIAAYTVAHYFILYTRFFQNGQYVKYTAGILALLIVTIFFDTALSTLAFRQGDFRENFLNMLSSAIMRGALFYTPAALFYTMIKANVTLRKRRRQLEQQQLESSLAILKHQLDPHFLFNTLNTVYATAMQEKAVKTASSIEELSALFRYSIQEAGVPAVPVEKELAFIEKYLHLQNLRLPENDQVKINTLISWDKKPAYISPMLLLPFIENAFKYGISYRQPSQVDVNIIIENAQLQLNIVNTDFSAVGNRESNGIGLRNVTAKLDLQYPGRHRLKHGKENNRYHVSLSIDL